MNNKISAAHRQRLAVVYLRQSTLRQVIDHPESTRRQYALRERALELGWPEAFIVVNDEDLGQSGTDSARRLGFQRLSEQVAQGRIGAIFVLETSRLSRSSADWHRLLDLCGVADVLLIDEQAVYHPADPNDRLMLGIKGTMSEAERGWMQLRLRGARVSKARRGDYRLSPPAGYFWDHSTARMQVDPDEEVQHAIHLVFERFRIERSAYGVMRYFMRHGLRLPAHGTDGVTVRWSAPQPGRILEILHNPIYAGAYVYGRRAPSVELVDGQVVRHLKLVSPGDWRIFHRNHHPGYIQWEEFVENQRILADNRHDDQAPALHGAVRAGEALLQGIVLCGRCGHRMHSVYAGRDRRARYCCTSAVQQGRGPHICWSVAAKSIDHRVAEMFLGALDSEAITLGLSVSAEVERQVDELDRQWALRLERARYEVRLAERRYKAVDPEHRTVARALEREWNAKLEELGRLEDGLRDVQSRDKLELTPTDRTRIAQLSRDAPQIWNAATTTMAQRKAMLRTLVREVCLTPIAPPEGGTRVRLLWQTGAVSEIVVERQLPGPCAGRAVLQMVRDLVATMTPAGQIAAALNEAHLTTLTGRPWTAENVHQYRRHHGIAWPHRMPTSAPKPNRRADGAYSIRGVAQRLRVSEAEVRYWIKRRWITSFEGGGRGRVRWFQLDPATIARLEQLRATHTRPRRKPGRVHRSERARRGSALSNRP